MHNIFIRLMQWLTRVVSVCEAADPLSRLTPRDWADLPVHHPRGEQC